MSNSVEEIKEEYKSQDNRCTEYPIYVTVQEARLVGISIESVSWTSDCNYFTENLYTHSLIEDETFVSRNHCIKSLTEHWDDNCEFDIEEEIDFIKCDYQLYTYQDVEVFLTVKAAERYIQLNKHNLNKPRTYIKHFHRDNLEMRKVLDSVGFKTN